MAVDKEAKKAADQVTLLLINIKYLCTLCHSMEFIGENCQLRDS